MSFLKKMFGIKESRESIALKKVLYLYNKGALSNWEEERYGYVRKIWCIFNGTKILFDYESDGESSWLMLRISIPNEKNDILIKSSKASRLFYKIMYNIKNEKLENFINL